MHTQFALAVGPLAARWPIPLFLTLLRSFSTTARLRRIMTSSCGDYPGARGRGDRLDTCEWCVVLQRCVVLGWVGLCCSVVLRCVVLCLCCSVVLCWFAVLENRRWFCNYNQDGTTFGMGARPHHGSRYRRRVSYYSRAC